MSADVRHEQAIGGADGAVPSGTDAGSNDVASKTAQEEGNKFQQAIAAWRNLNLTDLVSNLDTAASQLVEHQKDAVTQRKDLAQKTKDFRKLDDSGKLTEIKALLKSYQNFIDLLTNQSKAVNSAFLSAYTPLSEAPDPYPLLEASVESLVTSEELLPRLEGENKHLQKTVSKLTSQLEETEQQLEQERTSRQTSETSQDSKIKDVEESWNAVLKEKEDNWSAKEKSLEDKVENQDRLLKELKASYEVSQRLEKAGDEDGEASARKAANAEMEILNSELEKVSIRLSDMEARNEQLRLELAQSKSGPAQKIAVEDDPAFLRLRSENTALLRKLDSSKYERGSEQGKLEGRIKTLEREMSALVEDREALKKKLDKCSDYEEIKQELEMIRTIEFATGDDEEDAIEGAADDSLTNGHAKSSKSESLEQLLLTRNKKLTNELTELRVSHKDMQSQLESLQETLSTTNMELEKSRNLNAQLENEVTEAQQQVTNFDTFSVAGTYTSRYPKSSYAASRRGGTSPTSSIISGFDGGRSSPAGPGTPMGGGSGILPMVTAQRDRFKKKLADMETELQKSYSTVSSLRSEVASLQRDNLNLYEKTRYVSSYNRPSHSTASSAYAVGGGNPSTINVSGSDNTGSGLSLDRYKSAYESNLSPFAAFRGRESARAFKRMTLPERAIYAVARTVLATRTSRNLFALYCVALHVLVIYTLYFMGSADLERHAGNLAAGAVAGGAKIAEAKAKDWKQGAFDEGKA
ncbi:CASP-like protein [Elsinoe australis]|uniref:Protein CASP n=1 Tax=Elsinoe australis TaxID=40998 RepID=A0A4U7AW17_9PEZI|nr:CASP-like protein [Elsinoe australis]